VVDILHGVPITDPYRWLEDQNSTRTRDWIAAQTRFARAYLDGLPKRECVRERVRELLDTEIRDCFLSFEAGYIFRKRLTGEEQPSIYMRHRSGDDDELLVDPAMRGTGKYTSVKPLRVSRDGNLLLYKVMNGGERKGAFEILDIANRTVLPDVLAHGYLYGFAFAQDGRGFYYVHEPTDAPGAFHHAAYYHNLGSRFKDDREVFSIGEDKNARLSLVAGKEQLGILVYHFRERTFTDFYLWNPGSEDDPTPVLRGVDWLFGPRFAETRLLAMIDRDAPNRKIVEVHIRRDAEPLLIDIIPPTDAAIQCWMISDHRILVSYAHEATTQINIFSLSGVPLGQIAATDGETIRLAKTESLDDEVLLERESFVEPTRIYRFNLHSAKQQLWTPCDTAFPSLNYTHSKVSYNAKDGTTIPMFLVGRRDVLSTGARPTVMTAYGGYGIPMTPRFSVLVAFLMEHGCLFALPNIRGGSEFGAEWHQAGKRRNRQVAIDDFLSAAESLVDTGRTTPDQLAIFGGSNSGLLVGAAITQRPQLFRAALCMVPLLDMLRFHFFDKADEWKDEFGTAEDRQDFEALGSYSPYHAVRDGTAYPATMFVSGDADQNCNPLHARKMTARLQAASSSAGPIFLDYSEFRGHSPVLPLNHRIDALVDRLAFLCDRLGVNV